MANETERIPVLRFTEEGKSNIEDIVVREFPLTIVLNNQELVTLLCSPANLEYLAVGFLLAQGLIEGKDDIKNIAVDNGRGIVEVAVEKPVDTNLRPVLASSGGRSAGFFSAEKVTAKAETKLSASQVFFLTEDFVQRSKVFETTGGVHSAALCDTKSILVFSEDIGRHNAIDKIFGECLLKDMATDNRLIITSGRVSSEILLKVAKRNIPILVSKSAPTDSGVRLANDLGVTLVGFVRGRRMNVYAHDWRIVADGE